MLLTNSVRQKAGPSSGRCGSFATRTAPQPRCLSNRADFLLNYLLQDLTEFPAFLNIFSMVWGAGVFTELVSTVGVRDVQVEEVLALDDDSLSALRYEVQSEHQ